MTAAARPSRITLAAAVTALRRHYGAPPAVPTRDPFALVLWEQVAYLADDARRLAAFDGLRADVGLAPAQIAAAPIARLRAIARKGGAIAADDRAERMKKSAALVLARWGGDLRRALALPVAEARKALAQFPMIGEPGADKILAWTDAAPVLALDSNALRVVQRLGLAREAKDYRASYRAAQAARASMLPRTATGRVAAGQLLRALGQDLCRRGVPRCGQCPLRAKCPVGRASAVRS